MKYRYLLFWFALMMLVLAIEIIDYPAISAIGN